MKNDIQTTNAQIIELLAKGKTVKEVAAELGMSKRTVSDRIETMKKKHGSATIAQLVIKVISFNLSAFA